MGEKTMAEVIRSVTDLWDEPLDEVHDIPQIVAALTAAGFVQESKGTAQKPVVIVLGGSDNQLDLEGYVGTGTDFIFSYDPGNYHEAVPVRSLRKTSCPVRLMDGRNEISCWLEAGHEGKCK